MNRAEKAAEVDTLSDAITRAQLALCIDYRGINVAQVTSLRKDLNAKKTKAKVVKNTLARLAIDKALAAGGADESKKFRSAFDGPSMLLYSFDDPVSPAKIVHEMAKTVESIVIKGAWLDGRFLDKRAVEELAKLPGREELLAKLLSLLNAPAIQLLNLMQEPARRIVRVMDAHRAKLEASAGGAGGSEG